MPQPSLDFQHASPADLSACRSLLSNGSRTFFTASFLLPRGVRDPATALYAFCRQADDAVDLGASPQDAVRDLRERLERAYAGRPRPDPVDRAFADVVADFAIPRILPEALLEGIEWDARPHRYRDLSALYAYAARVAGTVGAMMAVVMGARAPEQIARACDLGVAMQLSNIARDVGEDARAGRLYLPLAWLREAGIDPDAWLSRPVYSAALGGVVQRLLQAADALYARADTGICGLPSGCRPAIFAARLLYAEIGAEVRRAGLDSVSRRAVVPGHRKAGLVARALARATLPAPVPAPVPAPGRHAPILEEVRFLVEAVAAVSRPRALAPLDARRAVPWWRFGERFAQAIELFIALEQREQLKRSGSEA